MKRYLVFALVAFSVAACSKKTTPTSPTDVPPKFTATLLPSNEVPAVTNADKDASGTVTITFNVTRDASGNVTAGGTADFNATFTGFPNGTSLTLAHIHNGVAGVNAGIYINLALASGEVAFPAGSGTLTKTVTISADQANSILANPAGFYFNVHTAANPGGAARGQLTRIQ
jgi:hypothetical protein